MDYAKRVMSGTWGSAWLDSDQISEISGAQAKVTYNKEKVGICGRMFNDTKVMSIDGTGSLTLHHVSSRMLIKIGKAIQDGKDLRFTIILKLDDPDAWGAERVELLGVSFDDLTLADWQHGTTGTITAPFTFTGFNLLDLVEPRN